MDCATLLTSCGFHDAEVHSLVRCGSRVYGTASASSDEDFLAVLKRRGQKQDLVFREGVNVVVHGIETFREALESQSVFALECLFAPQEHKLKQGKLPFLYKLDRKKLFASASARSDSDFTKAAKCFAEELEPSKKKLFHALRVPTFALQVMKQGKIVDYTAANPLWLRIHGAPSDVWEDYRRLYAPLRDELLDELSRLASKR